VRIRRCPHISDSQLFGCVAALVDSLSGGLHAATVWLHRLAASRKGSASACDLTLDTHRCGALIVLDRWSTLVGALGPHLEIEQPADVIRRAGDRVRAAEDILNPANLTGLDRTCRQWLFC
jgi:hypothetical protein